MSDKNDMNRYYNEVIDRKELGKFLLSDEVSPLYLVTDRPVGDDLSDDVTVFRSSSDLPEESQIYGKSFYVSFLSDSDATPVLKKIVRAGGRFVPVGGGGKTNYRFVDKNAFDAIEGTLKKIDRVKQFGMIEHENVCEALSVTKDVSGDFVEIGVYLGSSSLTAINYLELSGSRKKAYLIDTFDGFSYEEAETSADPIWKDTHKLFGIEKTMEYVGETIGARTIEYELFARNVVSDPLPEKIENISVLSIDVDMYEATKHALEKGAPLVQKGGVIILEDAPATPALYGAYTAMEMFLETVEGRKYLKIHKLGHYFLIKMFE